MATSQQQWRHRRLVLLLAAALALILLIGSAEAMRPCRKGWGNCDHRDGCETNLYNDKNNCGHCGHRCFVTWGQWAHAFCKNGFCHQACNRGYFFEHGRCHKRFHH